MNQKYSPYFSALIIDDQPLVKLAMSVLLRNEGIQIIGEAVNAREGMIKLQVLSPDLIILDTRLSEDAGMNIIQKVIKEKIKVNLLIFSDLEPTVPKTLLDNQVVKGFVSKRDDLFVLRETVRKIKQSFINNSDNKNFSDDVHPARKLNR